MVRTVEQVAEITGKYNDRLSDMVNQVEFQQEARLENTFLAGNQQTDMVDREYLDAY